MDQQPVGSQPTNQYKSSVVPPSASTEPSSKKGMMIVLIVAIVLLLGSIIALIVVWQSQIAKYEAKSTETSQKITELEAQVAALEKEASATIDNDSSAASQSLTAINASKLVTEFYNQYADIYKKITDTTQSEAKAVVAKYGTKDFVTAYAKNQSFNPVFCAQDTPASFAVAGGDTTSESSMATITTTDNKNGKKIITAKVIKDGTLLKIATITCPSTN